MPVVRALPRPVPDGDSVRPSSGGSDVVADDDVVVAVCDNAHEDLASRSTVPDWAGRRRHWSVPDPVRVDTDAAFESAYEDLADRVARLASFVRSDVDGD
jgi:protein-tyrosine-phosphatase